MTDLNKKTLLKLLKMMIRIRKFELAVEKNFQLGHIYGTAHLAIGQEASAAGAVLALKEDDMITSTHRGHGHCIAKGADIDLMMAEIFGKATGYCRGKGGSMHIADVEAGNLGANGIVGGSAGIAAGAALAAKKQGTGQIAVCFMGDGAINEGLWHESVNIASIWDLPVIYFVENNQYGMGMPSGKVTNLQKLSDRARGYNIAGYTIDGNDVIQVYKKVSQVSSRVRKDKKPALIEAVTYRIRGHSLRDAQRYRPEGETKKWMEEYCPIERLKRHLEDTGKISGDEIDRAEKEIEAEIEKAVQFALESPYLDPSELTDDIYA
jgi:acetoin:2,6-dichlorophenolindophenol oxidoreductase subunit alpha